MTEQDKAPLAGVRVLDLAPGRLGAAGRILLELGADVLRVEPPGGGADRVQGLTAGGVSLTFAAANLGKRAVALDLDDPQDRRRFETLAANADILIEAGAPGALAVAGLRAANPALVVLSFRDFGEGSFAGWRGTDVVLQALSGELSRSGLRGREPQPPPGELAIECGVAQGVYAALLGYLQRLQTGQGDHLELSLLEATTQIMDPGFGIAGTATSGIPASKLPRGRPTGQDRYPIYRCKDGHVRFCILAVRQWQGLFEWMGRPAAFADPAFNNMRTRQKSQALHEAISAFLADKTRAEAEAGGERYRIPIGGLLSLQDVLASEQMQVRDAIAAIKIGPGVRASFPNGVLEMDGVRAGVQGPPPSTGADANAVIAAWAPRSLTGAGRDLPGAPGRPLAALRVLDLGVIVVGGEQGRMLADYGADVIKVENAAFPDGTRASSPEPMPATFAAGHRNKRGLGLNLRDPRGRQLFLDLAKDADVVLSNFKPGTMESLGLGAEALQALNPRLIVAESSAFGPTGPWSERMGYGPLVRATAGLTALWRYEDDPEGFCDGITTYPDHICARYGVAGVLALLIRRLRTGRGGKVSLSQAEVTLANLAEKVAAASLAAQGVEVAGAERDAPYGVYPCAGDDEWCAVGVDGNADWQALCEVIGRSDLAADPALAAQAGRAANRARIDEAVAAWLAPLTPEEAMRRLQGGGVPAGKMLRVAELPDFAFFRERGFFDLLRQPQVVEPIVVDNSPVRSERLARPPLAPAPMPGEHSAEIVRERLGLGAAEIERLTADGVLEIGSAQPAKAPA
ncbi:MAG: CoA transferase [Phenylobacterium sp.]